jgi:hypothetical protein
MDDQTQQITDYIRQHISQGLSEADVRTHLLSNGWSQEAVTQAFNQYHSGAAVPPPMPAHQPANSYAPTPQHKKSKAKVAGIIGLVVVVGIIILIAHLLTSPKTLDKLATPTLQRNAANTSQKNDVAMVDSAVSNYVSSHNGVLPTTTVTDSTAGTLGICGADCTGSDKVTVTLSYFKNTPTAVQFHSYATNLTVPDSNTLYIVDNAACKSDNSGIGTQTSSGNVSAAFLYAYSSGSGIVQQCLGF